MVQKTVDFLFASTLLILSTQLYKFAAIYVGGQPLVIGVISVICILYLMCYRIRLPIGHGSLISWLLFLVGLPSLSIVFFEIFNTRLILLGIHFFLVLTASSVFFSKSSASKLLMRFVLIVSVLGLLWSLYRPGDFSGIAEASSARFSYGGRAFGLFLQPNNAAFSIILMTFCVFLGSAKLARKWRYFLFLVSLLSVYFSGSRAGFGVLLVLFSTYFVASNASNARYLVENGIKAIAFVPILTLSAFALLYGMSSMDFLQAESGVLTRILSISNLDLKIDISAQQRVRWLGETQDLILQKPLLGYGAGAKETFLSYGTIGGSSHNSLIDILLEYGALGLLVLCSSIYFMAKDVRKYSINLWVIFWFCFCPTILAMCFFTGTLFINPTFYIAVGLLYGSRIKFDQTRF